MWKKHLNETISLLSTETGQHPVSSFETSFTNKEVTISKLFNFVKFNEGRVVQTLKLNNLPFIYRD